MDLYIFKDINKIKKVQRYVARFVKNNASVRKWFKIAQYTVKNICLKDDDSVVDLGGQ